MQSAVGKFIDRKRQTTQKNETYEVINPATEEVIGNASKATPADVEKALKSAEKGFAIWKKTQPWQRASIIRKIADLMRKKNDILAK
jgi:succinate-semialdehyde dehydrogenase/glutarate-semialdehyde dehydrogenase